MKRILMLFAALVMFTACDDNNDDFNIERVIRDFNIQSSSWGFYQGDSDGPYFRYKTRFPELDNFKYNNGSIVVYMETEEGGVYTQKTLPFVKSVEDVFGQFVRTIDYEYTSDGYIIFNVRHSDFNYGNPLIHPESMTFRAVILY